MKNFLLIFSVLVLFFSCDIQKRHYLKGYYFKKDKKVETAPNDQVNSNTTTNSSSQQNNSANQNSSQASNSTGTNPPQKKIVQPTFSMYGGLQEGLSTLSLNAEKIFCVGPYFQAFARAGVGLSDVARQSSGYRKFIFSGGIAAGTPILKLGFEVGYGGYLNGNPASGFYDAFVRLIPGRKSVYLSASWWWAMNANEEMKTGAACGLGISF